MPQNYTIETISPKQRHWQSQYGDFISYHATLNTGEEVEIARKASSPAPQEGEELYGEIEETQFGSKFKKAQQPFQGGGGGSYSKRPDNSDGFRQGMCYNNAAAYVAAKSEKTLAPKDWAKAVHAYATALYGEGDLTTGTQPTSQSSTKESNEPKAQPAASGYDKFKQSRPAPKEPVSDVPDDDAEFASVMRAGLEADQIPLDEIPF